MRGIVVPACLLLDILLDENAFTVDPPQIKHDRSGVLSEIDLDPHHRDFEIPHQRSLHQDRRCLATLTKNGMIGLTSAAVDNDADTG